MRARLGGLAALLALAGCTAEAPTSAPAALPQAPPVAAVAATPPLPNAPVLAFAVADAIPEAQAAAVVADFDAALKAKLSALPLSSAYRVVSGGGQAARMILDADRAFEADNAQLKAELLLPLADAVAASRSGGAWVVHVIGRAPTAADSDLAERRAVSVLAYLGGQGVAGGRLRSETRSGGSTRSLELLFVPIIQNREARAWMAPESAAAAR